MEYPWRLLNSIQFQEITPLICEQFQDYLKGPQSGLSGSTPYDYWKRFKGVLKQAVKEGVIKKNPASERPHAIAATRYPLF